MPYVCIGLPVYNGEKYLAESLDSILAQTYGDFELIISDNASNDRTQEICNEYASKDKRIRYYRNDKNLGGAANHNYVFHLSNAKYFKWISHDDLVAPSLLEHCVKVLDTSPDIILCYPKTVLIDANGNLIGKYEDRLDLQQERPHDRLANLMLYLGFANAQFGLIRFDIMRKTRLMGTYVSADICLLMELCLLGKFYEIPEHLFFRRDHEKNVRKIAVKEMKKWYDPNYKESILSHRMKLFLEMFKAVNYINLEPYEKMLCYMQIRHWQIRRWRATGGRYKAIIKDRLFPRANIE
jgi:glycosyltransferase involved in cell wall biosynthesis